MAVALRVGPAADERTDHDLVGAVRCGEDEAFECLYERYRRRIATFVYGMVGDWARAEDVTQDVFISALRRMRETERPIAFKPWIYEIAKNACIDQFRRARRAEEVSFDADEALGAADYGRLADSGSTPDLVVERKEELRDLVGAFGGLSESHHDILVLRELEGLSYRQIGERMGLSRPSVESTLFRARRRLTEEYDELKTGRRCAGVRAAISASEGGSFGVREHRRIARHVAHCQPCRRHAVAHGAADLLEPRARPSAPARVAGFLPLPAFLRRSRDGASSSTANAGLVAAHLPVSAAGIASRMSPATGSGAVGWGRITVAGLAVALGAGAGVATTPPTRPAHHAPSSTAAAALIGAPTRQSTAVAGADVLGSMLTRPVRVAGASRRGGGAGGRAGRITDRAHGGLAGDLMLGALSVGPSAQNVAAAQTLARRILRLSSSISAYRLPGVVRRSIAPARGLIRGTGSVLARPRALIHHLLRQHPRDPSHPPPGQPSTPSGSAGSPPKQQPSSSPPQQQSQPNSAPPSGSGSAQPASGGSTQPSSGGSAQPAQGSSAQPAPSGSAQPAPSGSADTAG
jgi:RNA polymerase sigma factor (sigma-70 family)